MCIHQEVRNAIFSGNFAYLLSWWSQQIFPLYLYSLYNVPFNLIKFSLGLILFRVFLVHILPYADVIRRLTVQISVFSTNTGKNGPEKFRLRILGSVYYFHIFPGWVVTVNIKHIFCVVFFPWLSKKSRKSFLGQHLWRSFCYYIISHHCFISKPSENIAKALVF